MREDRVEIARQRLMNEVAADRQGQHEKQRKAARERK
jgi:hypothetical protein